MENINREVLEQFKNNEEFMTLLFEIETYLKRQLKVDELYELIDLCRRIGWTCEMFSKTIESGIDAEGIFSFELYMSKIEALIQGGVRDENSFNEFKTKNETFDIVAERIGLIIGRKVLRTREYLYILKWKEKWDDNVILAAIEVAKSCVDKNIFAYTDHILISWGENNVSSVEDVSDVLNRVRRDRERNNRKRSIEYSRPAYNEYPKNPLYHKFSDPGLLACPFCGGEDILLQNQYSQKVDGYYCMVVCNVCGARTRAIKNDIDVNPNSPNFWKSVVIEQVKALWNTRV